MLEPEALNPEVNKATHRTPTNSTLPGLVLNHDGHYPESTASPRPRLRVHAVLSEHPGQGCTGLSFSTLWAGGFRAQRLGVEIWVCESEAFRCLAMASLQHSTRWHETSHAPVPSFSGGSFTRLCTSLIQRPAATGKRLCVANSSALHQRRQRHHVVKRATTGRRSVAPGHSIIKLPLSLSQR